MNQQELESLYLESGNQFRKEKKFSQAIQEYLKALTLNPDSVSTLIELAKTYEITKDFGKAFPLYLRIVQAEPNNAIIRAELAKIFLKQGNLEESIATYQKALALPNPPLEAYRGLIDTLEKAGNLEEATFIYKEFLAKDGNLSLLFHPQFLLLGKFFLAKILHKLKRVLINSQIALKFHNQEVYLQIWNDLNQVNYEQSQKRLLTYPKIIDQYEVIKYFKQTSKYRAVNSACLSDEDIQYIEGMGLSPKYLELNKFGVIDRNGVVQQESEYQDSAISNQIHEFQFTSIVDKCIYAICPETGEVLKSNCSFVPRSNDSQYVFYRFVGREVFYVATGRQWLGFPKVCLYFPKTDFIFFFDNIYFREEEEFNDLKIHLVSNWQTVASYISESRDRKLAILINWSHFAHSIWNELSGIYRLIEGKYLETNKDFLFLVVSEPFGRLENIFSEISIQRLKRLPKNKLTAEILQNGYFVTRVGFNYIQENLVEQINQIAIKQCTSEFLTAVAEIKKKHFPLVWISLRVGDRTWVSQTEGIIHIASLLLQDFPNLGVVIDGYSLHNGYTVSSKLIEAIRKETEVANAIIAGVPPHLKVYDTIGSMLYQSLVWANAVDFYIAHHGTIQHKVGWFANKPGIVHSNKYIAISEKKLYDNPSLGLPVAGVRENCILPTYIDEKYITDIFEGDVERHPEERRIDLNNYDIDWRVIYNEALNMAQSLKPVAEIERFNSIQT